MKPHCKNTQKIIDLNYSQISEYEIENYIFLKKVEYNRPEK